jgi:hypothetical protein
VQISESAVQLRRLHAMPGARLEASTALHRTAKTRSRQRSQAQSRNCGIASRRQAADEPGQSSQDMPDATDPTCRWDCHAPAPASSLPRRQSLRVPRLKCGRTASPEASRALNSRRVPQDRLDRPSLRTERGVL